MRRLIFAICLSASLMEPAFADGHWYGGVGVGSTRYGGPDGTRVTTPPGTFTPSSFSGTLASSDSATAWSLDFGYRFNAYFALEGGYTDFGTANSTFTTTSPNASYAVDTKVRGETLDALGILPVGGGFTLFAKAGLLHYKSDVSDPVVFVDPSVTPPVFLRVVNDPSSTTGTTPDFGIGASYALTERFSVRAGVTYFKGKDDSKTATGLPVKGMPGIHLRYVQFECHF